MPQTEFFTMQSEADGLNLSLMLVRPDGEIRALVQLAHGMCEHKERYEPFMRYLAERGCLCVINDHRGHGASVHRREDLGYFYENGADALVSDLHQITRWMKAQHPGLPFVLFGHSMGSLAVRAYCAAHDRELDSLIVCGSPGWNPAAGAGLVLLELLAKLFGERHRSKLIKNMTTGAFARPFRDEGSAFAWLSANQENVRAYEASPLCGFNFTLNGNRALLKLMRRAYSLKGCGNPGLHVRFYSGADDPCAPDEKGFRSAVEAMQRAGYSDVQGRMFPGLRHEILLEKNAEEIFESMWREAIEPVIA